MHNYKFSLQNVLDWRRDQEDEAERELLSVRLEKENEEQRLEKLIDESVYLKEKGFLTTEIIELRQQSMYKSLLDDQIIQQKLIVEQMIHDVQRAERKLLDQYKEKKIIEKLKENEFDEYIEKLKIEEQKQLDEFATISFGREIYQ